MQERAIERGQRKAPGDAQNGCRRESGKQEDRAQEAFTQQDSAQEDPGQENFGQENFGQEGREEPRLREAREPGGRAPVPRPAVLVVAGSDSAGLAGLQMDLRALTALGAHGASAVTACTAQDGAGLRARNTLPAEALRSQLVAALDLRPVVVKAGMLASAEQLQVLADFLRAQGLRLVLDPVLATTAGQVLGEPGMADLLREQLLPLCELLTPNLLEARSLSGLDGTDTAAVEAMARALRAQGARAVLIKGGHGEGTLAADYYLGPERAFWLSSPRRADGGARGTGCALASAAAAALALGHGLDDAVVIAKMAINQGLRQAYAVADGQRSVQISGFPGARQDLPWLDAQPLVELPASFPDCGPLGLYPVVDRAAWLERLLPLGITSIQLRVKDLRGPALSEEVRAAVALSRRHGCRLFVNDHWELALATGAYGVHLGQEDLAGADLPRLRAAGLRLGISTHCHYEVARAWRWRPSYIACGPVYPTRTKDMPWRPQGPEGLRYWRRLLDGYPLVAIGGIDETRLPAVLDCGVEGVALVSAITLARQPEDSARRLLAAMAEFRKGGGPVSGGARPRRARGRD